MVRERPVSTKSNKKYRLPAAVWSIQSACCEIIFSFGNRGSLGNRQFRLEKLSPKSPPA